MLLDGNSKAGHAKAIGSAKEIELNERVKDLEHLLDCCNEHKEGVIVKNGMLIDENNVLKRRNVDLQEKLNGVETISDDELANRVAHLIATGRLIITR